MCFCVVFMVLTDRCDWLWRFWGQSLTKQQVACVNHVLAKWLQPCNPPGASSQLRPSSSSWATLLSDWLFLPGPLLRPSCDKTAGTPRPCHFWCRHQNNIWKGMDRSGTSASTTLCGNVQHHLLWNVQMPLTAGTQRLFERLIFTCGDEAVHT